MRTGYRWGRTRFLWPRKAPSSPCGRVSLTDRACSGSPRRTSAAWAAIKSETFSEHVVADGGALRAGVAGGGGEALAEDFGDGGELAHQFGEGVGQEGLRTVAHRLRRVVVA